MKYWIAGLVLVGSIVFLCISGYFLINMSLQERKDDILQEQLEEIYSSNWERHCDGEGRGDSAALPVHPGLLALHSENKDCIGWIRIDGTVIDYPVMYHPEEESFYLHRDFYGNYSANGCLFLSEFCNPNISDNLIIYGHHMNSGKMFAALEQYKDSTFYQEHPLIYYESLQGLEIYQIFSVFCTPVYTENDFPYYAFTKAENSEEYLEYVSAVIERALYDTGISVIYSDKLITLSTCEYSQKNGRIVIVAKKIY